MQHEVINIPPGWPGTHATVATAYRLVNASLVDPVVVTTAQNIVRHLPERDKWAEVQAVSNYVKRNVRYTNEGVETLKAPRLMLDEIKYQGKAVGDCDDHVILWAALHKAVGNPVRFRAISQHRSGLANHIYGEVYVPRRGWVSDELIVKHRPLGWHIPAGEVTKAVTYMGGLGGIGGRSMAPNGLHRGWQRGLHRGWQRGLHRGWQRGLHRGWRRGRRVGQRGYFAPGGAAVRLNGEMMPDRELFAVDPFVAQGYSIKHGGAMMHRPDGVPEEIGFIPGALVSAAAAVAKRAKRVLKRPRGPVPGSETPPPPPREKGPGLLTIGLLFIGGLAVISAVRR